MPKVPGLVKGLGVTLGTLFETVTKGANTVQYPHEKEAPPTRARGVIALHEDNCTSCMLCARSCPDWCIYIEGHKELAPPRREGGKERQVNMLDRFDIDYALCMYCGICVEANDVCAPHCSEVFALCDFGCMVQNRWRDHAETNLKCTEWRSAVFALNCVVCTLMHRC